MKNKILVAIDENVSFSEEVLSSYVEIILLDKAKPPTEHIEFLHNNKKLQALVISSRFSCNLAALPPQIELIISATSGLDHIILPRESKSRAYPQLHNARGANAKAVVDYVMACCAEFYTSDELAKKTFGILGYGNIGRLLATCVAPFVQAVKVYDPYQQDIDSRLKETRLKNLFEQSDLVSLHASLTEDSAAYPSRNLISASLRLPECLINAARGELISREYWHKILSNQDCKLACDTWSNEPHLQEQQLARANIASPHIAGYSEWSKLRLVYTALLKLQDRFFPDEELVGFADVAAELGLQPCLKLDFTQAKDQILESYKKLLQLNKTNREFKQLAAQTSAQEAFLEYRNSYALRPEVCGVCL